MIEEYDRVDRRLSGVLELLIVADKNMRYQQNVSLRRLAILELWTNHRPTLEREFAYIRAAAERMAPRQYLQLKAPLHSLGCASAY